MDKLKGAKQITENEQHSVSPSFFLASLSNRISKTYDQFGFEFDSLELSPLRSILENKLRMYAVEQSTTVQDITETLNAIATAFNSIKKICEKPKMHLKSVNEVRPIDTVKRVGYESIPYLASHSEDWLARTASGLKPARLFSRVEDDEWQIYENRVVKTLIDNILIYLKNNIFDLNNKARQLEGIIDSSTQTDSFGFDVNFSKAIKVLISTDFEGDEKKSKEFQLAKKLIERAEKLNCNYRKLKLSKLYKTLRKSRKVTNPLNETNILILDKLYSKAFKIWKELQKAVSVDKIDESTEQFEDKNIKKIYCEFCTSLTAFSVNNMGFEEIEENKFERNNDSLFVTIENKLDVNALHEIAITIGDTSLREMPLNGLQLPTQTYGSFIQKGNILYWGNDVTNEDIEKYCRLLKEEINQQNYKLFDEVVRKYNDLKQSINKANQKYGNSKCYKIKLVPMYTDIPVENKQKFIKSINDYYSISKYDCVIVALPKCEEVEQEIITYGFNNKVAFLPLTLFDINSYRRIQTILLRYITEMNTSKCPNCGSNTRHAGNGAECDSCKIIMTETQCPFCSEKFKYLHYNVNENTISNMKNIKANDFYKIDSKYKYKNIVNLDVGKVIIPICPHCHKVPDNSRANDCNNTI